MAADDGSKGEDHDDVIERHLRQGEMRLAIRQVAPHEHHGGAGGGGKDNEPGDVTVDLFRGQPATKQPTDEQPAKQRHGKRFHRPVDEQRYAHTAPVCPHPFKRAQVDLEQHGNDHQPDQDRHRQIDLRHLQLADGLECAVEEVAQGDAGHDAQGNPQGQVAFEKPHRIIAAPCARFALCAQLTSSC
jgi:hypothetical protein